jgi:hypothetical protein
MKKESWKFFTAAELRKHYGKPCKTFEPGCVVCRAWTRYDLLLQMEYEDECDRLEFEECK